VNWRRLLVALSGLAVFGAAVLVLVDPATAALVPVDGAVAALGFDYLLLAIVGVVALVVTLVVLALRAVGGLDQAEPPAPEEIATVPTFGADVDAVVEDGTGLRARLFGDERERVRERFRETAVATVMRVSNCSRAEARRQVATGAWTDDAEAAAFLASSGEGPGTWRTRFGAAFSGETPFQRGARHAAEAVVGLAETGGDRPGTREAASSASTPGEATEESSTDGPLRRRTPAEEASA